MRRYGFLLLSIALPLALAGFLPRPDFSPDDRHVVLPVGYAGGNIGPLLWLPGTDNLAVVSGSLGGGNGLYDRKTDVYTVEAGLVKAVTATHDVMGMGLTADGKALRWAKNPKYVPPTLYAFDLPKE